jgi:tetratricopeptide (TPR) repeat protein
LSPDPKARPQSANDLLADLEECQTTMTSGSHRRGQLIAAALALTGIAVVAVAALRYSAGFQKSSPEFVSDDAVLKGRVPTTNTEAYEEYLRGIALEARGYLGMENQDDTLRALENAVRLDPSFGLAWARLSKVHSQFYWFHTDRTENRIAQAKYALEMANKLQPELGETYLARGFFHYHCQLNYTAAIQDFSEARKRLPNSADALRALALVERRLGRWNEAAEHYQRAANLDPLNTPGLQQWGVTVECLQRFAEERTIINRIIAIAPDDPRWVLWKSHTFLLEGDLASAKKLVDSVMPQAADSDLVSMARSLWFYERNYQKVMESCSHSLQNGDINTTGPLDTNIELALAQKWSGDDASARLTFMKARAYLEKEHSDDPEMAPVAARLGVVCAGLGDRGPALRAGERAVVVSKDDPFDGPQRALLLAQIQAQLGNAEAALKELPGLLQTPASGLTPAALKFDPIWDPIRGDPRFQNLLASTSPDDATRISTQGFLNKR